MRYSAEIENWICVEDYGFLSFAKKMKKKKNQLAKIDISFLTAQKSQQRTHSKLSQTGQLKN